MWPDTNEKRSLVFQTWLFVRLTDLGFFAVWYKSQTFIMAGHSQAFFFFLFHGYVNELTVYKLTVKVIWRWDLRNNHRPLFNRSHWVNWYSGTYPWTRYSLCIRKIDSSEWQQHCLCRRDWCCIWFRSLCVSILVCSVFNELVKTISQMVILHHILF